MVRSNRFARFDYGKEENQEYDVDRIKQNMQGVPMQLYVGTRDFFIHKKDLRKLLNVLPEKHREVHMIDDFGHLDYMWSPRAEGEIWEPVVRFLKQND